MTRIMKTRRMAFSRINFKFILLTTIHCILLPMSNGNLDEPTSDLVQRDGVHDSIASQHLYIIDKARNCCKQSFNTGCRNACMKQFSQNATRILLSNKDLLLKEIISVCQPPFINITSDQMWHCFLRSGFFDKIDTMESTTVSTLKTPINFGLNYKKWSCCERSTTESCRSVCYKTFGNDWLQNWPRFQEMCVYSSAEHRLRQCLEQTSQTCSFGCQSKLDFCDFFFEAKYQDNRTDEFWFRNCNTDGDISAMITYQKWLYKGIVAHLNNDLYGLFPEHAKCSVDMVKILACTIHLQPCLPGKHSTETCMFNDCRMQNECIDWAKAFPNETDVDLILNDLDVPRLCLIIPFKATNDSQTSNSKCYTINHYNDVDSLATDNRTFYFFDKSQASQVPAVRLTSSREVNNTCLHSKCLSEIQLCTRNDQCGWNNCSPEHCIDACKVGKLLEMWVPFNNYYQIEQLDNGEEVASVANDDSQTLAWSRQDHDCHHLCRCVDITKHAGECYSYCLKKKSNEKVANDILDQIDCLGDCIGLKGSADNYQCNNKTNFNDLNDCLQKCSKNSVLMACPEEKKIPMVCVEEVEQFRECSPETSTQLFHLSSSEGFHFGSAGLDEICKVNISETVPQPVCDDKGTEYSSLCNLHLRQVQLEMNKPYITFAYLGKCQIHCSPIGEVCGRDGRTYKSECAANIEQVLVDHFSPCHKLKNEIECPNVDQCPSNDFMNEILFNQCPFCGSVAYFYYDSMFLTRMFKTDRISIVSKLVKERELRVATLAKQLNSLVSVAQCKLYAHLVNTGLMAVLMKPSYVLDKQLHYNLHRICREELVRITMLIKNRSPSITPLFPLSLLRYNQTINNQLQTMATTHRKLSNSSIDHSNILVITVTVISLTFLFKYIFY